MIDYLVRFDEPLSPPEGLEPGAPSWEDAAGKTIMPVSVFKELSPGDDETPAEIEYAPGHWYWVACAEIDDEVWSSMPAMQEADRESGELLRTRLTDEQREYGWQISPILAGSNYSFM